MLRIVGDINFTDGFFDTGFGVGSLIERGKKNPFENLIRKESDFWIGNFECVCASTSNKEGIYRKQFIISPEALSCVKHFDLYGVANNHVMQHGPIAYEEMLDYLKRNDSLYVGALKQKSIIIEHQNKKIGIIAFSCRPDNFSDSPLYWSMPEYSEIEEEIAKLQGCDYRIIYVHWGNEFINYPYVDQQKFAHFLIDKGADLIVGMHPHVLQGFEIYKNKYIFYSLGNFVFNMPWLSTKYSVIVNVDFVSDIPEISWIYTLIGRNYFPVYVEDNCVPKKFHFEYLNTLIHKEEENECYYLKVFRYMREYRKSNYKDILCNIPRIRFSNMIKMLNDFVKRKIK